MSSLDVRLRCIRSGEPRSARSGTRAASRTKQVIRDRRGLAQRTGRYARTATSAWQYSDMGATPASPVFVGRAAELTVLAEVTERVAEGAAGFVVIGGEAGVGKARLVEEVALRAQSAGLRVLYGRCVELGAAGLPFASLLDALRELVRSTPPGELDAVLGPGRRQLARLLPELDLDAAEPGLTAGGAGTPGQLLKLVLGVIERLSAVRPLLLILEDGCRRVSALVRRTGRARHQGVELPWRRTRHRAAAGQDPVTAGGPGRVVGSVDQQQGVVADQDHGTPQPNRTPVVVMGEGRVRLLV